MPDAYYPMAKKFNELRVKSFLEAILNVFI